MPEFDTLIKVLEEDRPVVDPAFARQLDQRAADGFAKPPRSRRLPRLPLWFGMPAAAVASLVLVVVVVAGNSGGGDDGASSAGSGASSAASGSRGGTAAQAPAESAAQSRDSAVAPPPTVPPALGGPRARLQEQTAGLTLVARAKDVADVGDRIVATADGVGGYVVSSDVRATDGTTGGGEFLLRVPVARLDDALARLSRLAHVQERTQGSQDITAERNVVRERLQEATAERRSLLTRLGEATTDNQVAGLKGRLADVNGAIASNRAALEGVQRRARFAAVQVTLQAADGSATPAGGDDGRWTPGDALRDGGRVLEVAAAVLVVVGSVLVPLALLALLGLGAQRAAGRRGRSRMLETV